MELVSPAGSLPALKAAVEHGANCVYAGFRDDTNARNFAGLNFSSDDLRAGIAYAHSRGAKVFLAINTYPQQHTWERWCAAIAYDFADERFLKRITDEARTLAAGIEADPKALDGEVKKLERQLQNLLDLAADTGDRDILARIHAVRGKLDTARGAAAAHQERAALKRSLQDTKNIRTMLAANSVRVAVGYDMRFIDEHENWNMEPAEVRRVVMSTISRIVLDPDTREFTISYRIPVAGVSGASPRRAEQIPGILVAKLLKLKRYYYYYCASASPTLLYAGAYRGQSRVPRRAR